jgi:hypothetical protein
MVLNKWIAFSVVGIASLILTACNGGGGGGGGGSRPSVDCRLAQNYNNPACYGNANGRYGRPGYGAVALGAYQPGLPPAGRAPITSFPNPQAMTVLCQQAVDRSYGSGGYASRGRYQSSAWESGDEGYYQNVGFQGSPCMNFQSAEVSFKIRAGSDEQAIGTWAMFVNGIQIPGNREQYEGAVHSFPGGFRIMTPPYVLTGTYSGNQLVVAISFGAGPGAVIASGAMSPQQ